MSDTYEFIDGSSKEDVNTLVVDFSFTSDVTKEEATRKDSLKVKRTKKEKRRRAKGKISSEEAERRKASNIP